MKMNREQFLHEQQDREFEFYRSGISFQESIEKVYKEIDFKLKKPDMLGKTVKVSEKQFSKIYNMVYELSLEEGIKVPDVYVYEDYYYGVESYGIDEIWIEMSAKTIKDLNNEELRFLIAREIYKIADGITYQKTIMEQQFKALNLIAPHELEKISKLSFYRWFRLANYTADNYGYIKSRSLTASIRAILILVLNSVMLADEVDIKEYIQQASEINKIDDIVSNYAKADEAVPYAPFRIKNILLYASSERGILCAK